MRRNVTSRNVTYVWLPAFSFIFIVVSFLIPTNFWGGFLQRFVEELGIAGSIGFILVVTIERVSKEEFKELALKERADIKRDVFYNVYGRHIPPEVRNQIDSQILDAKFLKKNHSIEFELSRISGGAPDEFLILSKCTLEYDIQNLASEPELFTLHHSIDKPPATTPLDHVKFTYVKVKNNGKTSEYDEGQLKPKQTDIDNQIKLVLKNEINLESEKSAHVIVKCQNIRLLKGGRINFTFPYYTLDLTLKVSVTDKIVFVSAGAFSPQVLKIGPDHKPETGVYQWKLEHPLLPHQGFYVTWDPAPLPPKDPPIAGKELEPIAKLELGKTPALPGPAQNPEKN